MLATKGKKVRILRKGLRQGGSATHQSHLLKITVILSG